MDATTPKQGEPPARQSLLNRGRQDTVEVFVALESERCHMEGYRK
jgi:hypothetical protein